VSASPEKLVLVRPDGTTSELVQPVPIPNPYDDFDLIPFQPRTHPALGGFRVMRVGHAAEDTEGINVDLPVGDPLSYLFDHFPKNSWAGIADRDGSQLPLLIYIRGSLWIKGRWLSVDP
jgi:hypothetical protein